MPNRPQPQHGWENMRRAADAGHLAELALDQAIAEAGLPCGITIANDGETAIQRLATLEKLPDHFGG